MKLKSRNTILAFAGILLVLVVGTAFARQTSGNLSGSVTDEPGDLRPGVTLALSGQGTDGRS